MQQISKLYQLHSTSSGSLTVCCSSKQSWFQYPSWQLCFLLTGAIFWMKQGKLGPAALAQQTALLCQIWETGKGLFNRFQCCVNNRGLREVLPLFCTPILCLCLREAGLRDIRKPCCVSQVRGLQSPLAVQEMSNWDARYDYILFILV